MTRIDGMDWCELEKIAAMAGVKLVYRRARCQHGYTRSQTCVDCEGGYVTDAHTYANVGNVATLNGEPCIAVSDDGEDVAYIPDRMQSKLAHV